MNRILILIFTILIFTSIPQNVLFSQLQNHQQIDSFKKELNTMPDDSNKVNYYLKYVKKLYSKSIDSAIYYTKESIKLSKKISWDDGLIDSYRTLSNLFTITNIDSTIYYNNLAIKLLDEIDNQYMKLKLTSQNCMIYRIKGNDSLESYTLNTVLTNVEKIKSNIQRAEIYLTLGNIYIDRVEYKLSGTYFLKAKNIFKAEGDEKKLAKLNRQYGTLYYKMNDYDKAIQLFKKAISVYKKNKEEYIVSTLNLYIGNTYFHKNEIDSALPYLNKSLEFKEKINDKANLSTLYKTISKIYFKKNLLDSAVKLIKKSIEINKSSNYIKSLSKDYLSLAEYYISLNQHDSTIYYIKESIKISPDDRSVRLDSYIGLSEVYERKKDYKNSLDWLRKGYDLRDSINEEFNKNDLKVLDAKYELAAEKNKAIARDERSQIKIIFISIIASILLLFLVIIYKKNRTRKKLNNQLESQNSQLNTLNSKIEKDNKEKIRLKEELHYKEIVEKDSILKKLSTDVLEKNSAIEQLKNDLKKECQANPEIQATITSLLQKNLGIDSDIRNFDEHLRINYKDFHTRLVEKYPDLTPTEVKVCTLIKMNYDSKEIAGLLERSYRTVETHRSNIRKKMDLESSESLENNIFTIKK